MGIDPLTIGLVLAATSAAIAAQQASEKNRQVKNQQQTLQNAARVQATQLADQRTQQLSDRRLEATQLAGRLAASTADAGVGFGTTYAGLDNTIASSLARASTNIERNYQNSLAASQAGVQLSSQQLDAQRQNTYLTGITGALSGFSTGLQIGGAVDEYNKPVAPAQTPTTPTRGYYGKEYVVP